MSGEGLHTRSRNYKDVRSNQSKLIVVAAEHGNIRKGILLTQLLFASPTTFHFPSWDLGGNLEEPLSFPTVPGRVMLILYIYFCFVFHSSTPNRICGAEVWHTSAAIARELSYSYRRSFSDDQIGLTDQFFEFRLLAFTLARLIFLHCMCFGVSSTYFAFVFQE